MLDAGLWGIVEDMSIRHQITATDVPLLVLDDGVVTAYAHRLVDAGHPVAVVGTSYPPVLPFLVGATGSAAASDAGVGAGRSFGPRSGVGRWSRTS